MPKHFIDDATLIECCKALYTRSENGGSWVGGKFPACFYRVQQAYGFDGPSWVLNVEKVAEMFAIEFVATQAEAT